MNDTEKKSSAVEIGVIAVQDQGLVVAAQHLFGPWVRQPLKPCDLKKEQIWARMRVTGE